MITRRDHEIQENKSYKEKIKVITKCNDVKKITKIGLHMYQIFFKARRSDGEKKRDIYENEKQCTGVQMIKSILSQKQR
jgi:hypothetical protein